MPYYRIHKFLYLLYASAIALLLRTERRTRQLFSDRVLQQPRLARMIEFHCSVVIYHCEKAFKVVTVVAEEEGEEIVNEEERHKVCHHSERK